MEFKPLKIGDLTIKYPVVQGGMGVGISLSSLAGAVAKAGGMGIISTAQIGFRDPGFDRDPIGSNLRAIGEELKKARKIAPGGVIGFNIMTATRGFEQYVREAAKCGADIIISGAGLPTDMPKYVEGTNTKIAPIVSSKKSASVICKLWDRHYKKVPDMVVIEGPKAGGHLGFSVDQLETFTDESYGQEIREIIGVVEEFEAKYEKDIPVVVAGGISTHEDVLRQLELGADGVQVATRFVTTYECDAPDAYKQAYLDAKEEDIVIVKSPVGMPGRAISNAFLEMVESGKMKVKSCHQCLAKCDPSKIPYCITDALVNAARGNVEQALLFCGADAYKAKTLQTVQEVMDDLLGFGELAVR